MRGTGAGIGAVLTVALLLTGCGSDKPPPLTGNLVDARGAHAGSFRVVADDTSNATPPANSQDAAR